VLVREHNGAVIVRYGLVRGKTQAQADRDKARKEATTKHAEEVGDRGGAHADDGHISNALLVRITEAQTRAMGEVLAQSPALLVRLVVAALTPTADHEPAPVRLQPDGMGRSAHHFAADDDAPPQSLAANFLAAFDEVPDDLEGAARALGALALRFLDLRQIKYRATPLSTVAEVIAATDPSIYLPAIRGQFDAEDYFASASGKIAKAALDEMGRATPTGANKSALAAAAAAAAQELGWLPPELRHPQFELAKPAKKKARAA
jgi:hypothetical protein